MTELPQLSQFRLEIGGNGVAHLVFDCPGRTMNVFSDAAIVEIGLVAAWLPDADVRGLLIRSGKANAFCAGADLTELGVAYDMIMAAPQHRRFNLAADHFFRLSLALRALETAGKPVAAAMAGLALGGGCEFALAAHHRVLVDDPKVAMGLPESLVGLFPGAGGTQRLPRLVGVAAALPILLDGVRVGGEEAVSIGLVHRLAKSGEEVAAAEEWLLDAPNPVQPWDREGYDPPAAGEVAALIESERARVLDQTRGHYPAPLAILDCVESGLPQVFDGAIRTENALFAHLIQREEPRNMIQTLFLAKTEYERLSRRGDLPSELLEGVERSRPLIQDLVDDPDLQAAGFFAARGQPVRSSAKAGYWLDAESAGRSREAVDRVSEAVAEIASTLAPEHRRLFDYAVVGELGYPAYLGGPVAYVERDRPPS